MADELSAPLGRRKRTGLSAWRPRRLARLPLARIGFALVGLIVVVVGGRILFVNDPEGGRPSTTVPINSTRNDNAIASSVAAPAPPGATTGVAASAAPSPSAATITPATAPPGASITIVNPDLPSTTADAGGGDSLAANRQGVIPALAEDTKNGPIPRISAKGQTPFIAYQRPVTLPADQASRPKVAIVVTGLGLDEQSTLDAADRLPPDVDMAFAPYGKALDRTVAAARAAGHELLLEVPLEPFDYPDTDPGPQTLLTGQPPRANLDKLYWLLARFGGYVGLINFTGARFTASAADFSPIMEELGTRGLGYLDDGTSNRSLAPQLAGANKVPFGRADMVLDANPARGPILAALDQLAQKAVANGQAIGVISALPVSIATVTEWASTMDTRNVALVPASALMK